MHSSIFTVSDYKLTDLLSSAGATIGIIIAGTIFLQFLSTKYVELSARFREMAAEYRTGKGEEPRHAPLRTQLWVYRRRLVLLNWGSCLGALELLFFWLAVLSGGLSLLKPTYRWILIVGTCGLFAGLICIGAAVALELVESILTAREIREEVADLDEGARGRAS
jgi:hypothetical protein